MENFLREDTSNYGFATKAIRAGQDPERWKSRSIVPLIVSTIHYSKS
jgi:hypothetical protein